LLTNKSISQVSNKQSQIFVTGIFPSIYRYRKLFFNLSDLSILRILEYERLEKHSFSGRILDFGGGENSRYRSMVNKWAHNCLYESVNIDKNINPTYIIDESTQLPLSDNQFEHVLTLNTLEHIYDIRFTLKEIHRVLKPNGEFVVSVPFIFRAHGHPDDYFRGSASWWFKMLNHIGFNSVEIEALHWGPFTTALTISGIPGPFKRMRLHSNLLTDLLYTTFRYYGRNTYCEAQDASVCNAPLGYFITARKGI
jgi:SAM-dependent methyltransferase